MILASCQDRKKENNMENPFFEKWHGVPPFDKIEIAHYLPAVEQGIKEQNEVIASIIADKAAPTFENTIYRLDKSDYLLDKVTARRREKDYSAAYQA